MGRIMSPQNIHIALLTPSVTVLGDRAFKMKYLGLNKVLRVRL